MPPLSAAGRAFSNPASPNCSKRACAVRRAPRPWSRPRRAAASAALSSADSHGSRASRCGISAAGGACTLPRRASRARTPATAASTCRTRSGRRRPPASPRRTSRSTPSSATTSPNALRTPATATPPPRTRPRHRSLDFSLHPLPPRALPRPGSKGQRRLGALSQPGDPPSPPDGQNVRVQRTAPVSPADAAEGSAVRVRRSAALAALPSVLGTGRGASARAGRALLRARTVAASHAAHLRAAARRPVGPPEGAHRPARLERCTARSDWARCARARRGLPASAEASLGAHVPRRC